MRDFVLSQEVRAIKALSTYNATEARKIAVVIKNIKTNEILEFASLTEAGKALGVTKASYGHDKFNLEILEYCEKEDLIEREQYYLDKLTPEYNVLKQAYSLLGFKHSDETIEKLRLKTLSEEQKEFISQLHTGKKVEEETRLKLSESLKEYHKNNPLTSEALENITRKTTEREGVKVTLKNLETDEEYFFDTKTDAGKYLGITRQAIHQGLKRESVLSDKYIVSLTNMLDDDNDAVSLRSKKSNETFIEDLPPSFLDDID
ncbi:hypothetical protein LOZ53_000003 (mitochondrion) [Ophidiomyces ophidiicola]|nr:hypothetical protein LOZ55_000003 [Ophidiomyces ophidiicola]KAI1996742.1 hypothetical protein LOZ54_000003 [Ophidiomyces ophidiicola]KAI1998369.1 hypothetical protein LOZ53_000003 [Ophidiomyces ophidiicola]